MVCVLHSNIPGSAPDHDQPKYIKIGPPSSSPRFNLTILLSTLLHYFKISITAGFLAVFSIASCQDTWSLYSRAEEEDLLLFALTEADCPRLPVRSAVTVTYMDPGQELPQLLLDLRTRKAFKWKSAILLHDETLSEYLKQHLLEMKRDKYLCKDKYAREVAVHALRKQGRYREIPSFSQVLILLVSISNKNLCRLV